MIDRRFFTIVFALSAVSVGFLATPALTKPGDVIVPQGAERKAVLNALRTPVEEELGPPIEFVVKRIAVVGDWAFVMATPQHSGGVPIDWAHSVCSGDVSHLVGGLMKRSDGGWKVVDMVLCPTDVAWATWPQDYGAPSALFDLPP